VNPYVNRDELINSMLPKVKQIAYNFFRKFANAGSNLEIEDLVQIGVLGLIDAAQKFDPLKNNKFETYAEYRIKGSIIDELRKEDWLPRYMRDNVKRVQNVIKRLSTELMREPTEEEIAEQLGMTLDEVFEALKNVSESQLLSFADIEPFVQQSKNPYDPFEWTVKNDLKVALTEAIKKLDEQEQLVLSLYYYDELNLAEIGLILDITESRVSQIRSTCFKKLKILMKDFL